MMTLRLFDNQDHSNLDSVSNMCTENNEAENYDYLRECITNFENKDSGLSLLTASSSSDIGIQGNSLDDINADLNNIDFNFMKIESLLLQNAENSENYAKNKEIKQEKFMDVNILDSIENLDTMTLSYNIFTNFSSDSSKEFDVISQNNVPISTNNSKPYMFSKDLITHYSEIKQRADNHNYPTKLPTKNNENMYSNMNSSQNIISEFKNQIKIDKTEMPDGDGQVRKCEQCLMTFRYKRHLDRHLEGHQKNNCPHCNEKFARRKHLDVHLFRIHGERNIRHPHLCDVCPRSFPKRALLNHHRAKHYYQSGKVCSECGDMITADTDDKEHEENHCKKRQFKCKQCSQTFSIEQTYLSHIQNHNNHKCPSCDVTFASKRKAYDHFRTTHSPKLRDSETSPYFCANCRHTFIKKDDYFRHLESALHLSRVSRDIPIKAIFSCVVCDKKLITQRALDQHIRRIHKGEKRFACDIYGCTFQCARRTDLDRHKHLHVEERNIVCEHCGKTFTSVSILKDHVLYIHNKERQFICEECGKAFKRNSLLKRHKLSHEQYRPFACMQCSTAFKRSHHLTRHMETCHRITLEKKKKMVKLMKTEDGHLIPVPEKSKKSGSDNIRTGTEHKAIIKEKKENHSTTTTDEQVANASLELQVQQLPNSEQNREHPNSVEFTNLAVIDNISQILSLIDTNTGQVLTVEVTNPELLPINDQFRTNCSEMLNLPDYQDMGFQNSLLTADQIWCNNIDYSEVSLENIEYSPAVMNNTCKIETIENYLINGFPPFFNL